MQDVTQTSDNTGKGLTIGGIIAMVIAAFGSIGNAAGWGSGATWGDIVRTWRNLPMLSVDVFLVATFVAGLCATVVGILRLSEVPLQSLLERVCLFALGNASNSQVRYVVVAFVGVAFMVYSVSAAGRSTGIGALFLSIFAGSVAFLVVFALANAQQQINKARGEDKASAVKAVESERDGYKTQRDKLQGKYDEDTANQNDQIAQLSQRLNALTEWPAPKSCTTCYESTGWVRPLHCWSGEVA